MIRMNYEHEIQCQLPHRSGHGKSLFEYRRSAFNKFHGVSGPGGNRAYDCGYLKTLQGKRYIQSDFDEPGNTHRAGIKRTINPTRYLEQLVTVFLRQRILLDRINWNQRGAHDLARKVN